MRLLIQRAGRASVSVDGQIVASIGGGLVVLVGVKHGDTEDDARYLADKVRGLRIFADAEGKMNRAIDDTGGEFLVVSQFTLFADTSRGRRPSFVEAADPESGERLYEYFLARLREGGSRVQTGVFGAHMMVELVNDGPVTIIMDGR